MSVALACAGCPVRDRAACAALSPCERAELAAAGRIVELARGETLFAAGDDSDRCATLIEGALKVTSFDREGTERVLALVHPAGFVGELFTPFARHDVVALTDSRLCVFGTGAFQAALHRYPALAETLLRRASADLYETRELIGLMGRRQASAKVAGLLLAFSRAASESPCHGADAFDLPLSRGDMAGLLGLTIETVSRQLSAFERDGLIRKHGARGIELVDPARLGGLVN
ncbi:Crp/Fnr family transcriptional regulator [Novosphingobium sp. Gsoil 351]|uniref:Crp/Fnr family transcriptional regulator n=1 Tax=Novosphingobium sp. Gsoil 351 TaxID=2675225 RepID=UPI0012B4F5C4|nr:Crp/Fnr family transcriptional regulator [Novosphingobium sp. Gsoil 351]QGN54395.1 helix-turn-helix domain-containing protein [Novosphingobium sp. Gsoil 351]